MPRWGAGQNEDGDRVIRAPERDATRLALRIRGWRGGRGGARRGQRLESLVRASVRDAAVNQLIQPNVKLLRCCVRLSVLQAVRSFVRSFVPRSSLDSPAVRAAFRNRTFGDYRTSLPIPSAYIGGPGYYYKCALPLTFLPLLRRVGAFYVRPRESPGGESETVSRHAARLESASNRKSRNRFDIWLERHSSGSQDIPAAAPPRRSSSSRFMAAKRCCGLFFGPFI